MSIEVFYSYAHEDEALRDTLEKHLSLLKRSGHITSWHDRRIGAGGEWRAQIDAHARSAQIILLLISPDFVASDYCFDVEMKLALERQARHEAIVIPVILRPVDWSGAPFSFLQALPRDAKAVTTWSDRDEAFTDIALGIRNVVSNFGSVKTGTGTVGAALINKNLPKPRVLDAAIPSHIVKDWAAELQVLVRLPDSPGLKGILLADETSDAKPEDVFSRDFKVTFPLSPDGRPEPLKVIVRLTCPEFNPPTQAKQFFIPVDEDSDVVSFLLTPVRIGKLRVLIELQWRDALQGSRRLITECVVDAASVPSSAGTLVLRIPLDVRAESPGAFGSVRSNGASSDGGDHRPASDAPSRSASAEIAEESGTLFRYITRPVPASPTAQVQDWLGDDDRAAGDGGSKTRPETDILADLRLPAGAKARAKGAASRGNLAAVAIALIGAIPIALGSYWQWVYKPTHAPDDKIHITYSVQVLNAQTKEFVPDARLTVALDGGNGSVEKYTDSSGSFFFDLGEQKRRTHGRIYVHASNFEVLEKDFTLDDAAVRDELRLQPSQNAPQVVIETEGPITLEHGQTYTLPLSLTHRGPVEVSIQSLASDWKGFSGTEGQPGQDGLYITICTAQSGGPCNSRQMGKLGALSLDLPAGSATISVFNFDSNPRATFTLRVKHPT